MKIWVIIAVVGLAIYANSLDNSFLYDDHLLVQNNKFVTSIKYIPQIFTSQLYSATRQSSNFYRPLVNLSFMLDYQLWKLKPFGYHLTNVLIHIINAILVYLLGLYLFRKFKLFTVYTSMIAALLFLTHPVHTSVVSYVSSRADLLSAMFVLLSILLYTRKAKYLGVLCFIAALLSKESAIVLPLFLIFLDKDRKRTIPFFIIGIIYISLRFTLLHFPATLLNSDPLHLRILTAIKTIPIYLRLLVLPYGLHFGRTIFRAGSFFDMPVLLSVLFLGGTIYYLKRFKVSMLWFFIFLIPTYNILPLNARIAENWLYLPSIGIIFVFCFLISQLPKKKNLLVVYNLSLVTIIAVFSFLTFQRNIVWGNEKLLFKESLQHNPDQARVNNNLAIIYQQEGEIDKAIEHYKEAIRIRPSYVKALSNLGLLYAEKGELKKAAEQLEYASVIDPQNASLHVNLGMLYYKQGNLERALEENEIALQLNPNLSIARNNITAITLQLNRL